MAQFVKNITIRDAGQEEEVKIMGEGKNKERMKKNEKKHAEGSRARNGA